MDTEYGSIVKLFLRIIHLMFSLGDDCKTKQSLQNYRQFVVDQIYAISSFFYLWDFIYIDKRCPQINCVLVFLAGLLLVSAHPGTESKAEAKEEKVSSVASKKQDKRGLFDLGYGGHDALGGGIELGGYGGHGGLELGGYGLDGGYGGFGDGHVKSVTITKEVKVPVPAPYPVHIEKKIPVPVPYKVAVPVDRPYPVHVPKPYPVPVEKPVPYPVIKKVPYPVKVPVKVPYPVPHPVPILKPVPYPVHKPVPYPVKVPVVVEKKVPIIIHSHDDHSFGGGFGGGLHGLGGGLDLHSYH